MLKLIPLCPARPPSRFLNGSDEERISMLKLIPHIPNASWVIKQSVGTVPVIVGTKLKTTFYQTDRWVLVWRGQRGGQASWRVKWGAQCLSVWAPSSRFNSVRQIGVW